MDIKRLRKLATGLPCGGRTLYLQRNAMPRPRVDCENPWEDDIDAYIRSYKDVSFGHTYVRHLVRSGLPFPIMDRYDEETSVLRGAYDMLRGDRCTEDLLAVFAWTRPEMKNQRATIEALLMSDGASVAQVCARTGILPRRLMMYEKLFFNVLDRASDSMYVNDLVYPNSRVEEFYDGYIKEAPFHSLLMRAAYNNGTDDAMWMAGHRRNKAVENASRGSLPSKFETLIMANGYIMARNGFGMQSGMNAPAVSAAKNFIAASKQAGDNASGAQLPEMASLATVVAREMQTRLAQAAAVREAAKRAMLASESAIAKAG